MTDKVYGMLGMARKAGKLVGGESMTLDSIKTGKARMVIVASDASDNTKKLFHDKCRSYGVELYEYGEKVNLGWATGSGERSSLAIIDDNFAEAIKKRLNIGGNEFES